VSRLGPRAADAEASAGFEEGALELAAPIREHALDGPAGPGEVRRDVPEQEPRGDLGPGLAHEDPRQAESRPHRELSHPARRSARTALGRRERAHAHDGRFQVVEHGRLEPVDWEVSVDHLERIVAHPDRFVAAPELLALDWLEDRLAIRPRAKRTSGWRIGRARRPKR
jgi:hypothetical protein